MSADIEGGAENAERESAKELQGSYEDLGYGFGEPDCDADGEEYCHGYYS